MADTRVFGESLYSCWATYRRCAKRSRTLKARIGRFRIQALLLFIIGGVVGLLVEQSNDAASVKALALFGAVCLVAASYISTKMLDPRLERRWTLARTCGEALKSESFRYLSRSGSYGNEDRDAVLLQKHSALIGDAVFGFEANLTTEELAENLPKGWLTADDYIEKRSINQIDWYMNEARHAQRKYSKFMRIVVGLGFAGALLSAAAGFDWANVGFTAWIAIISAISASITTYIYANRFEYLAQRYELTARRLTWIKDAWLATSADKQNLDELVDGTEAAIAFENSQWLAEWEALDPAHSPPPAADEESEQ